MPIALRCSNRPRFAEGAGAISSRYTSASGEVIGLARTRRSGAGTQRARNANASEPHKGQLCASWISLQSRQSRATWSCMRSMYVGAFDLGKATLTRRWQRLVPPATLKGGGSGWHWRDDAARFRSPRPWPSRRRLRPRSKRHYTSLPNTRRIRLPTGDPPCHLIDVNS